MYLYLYFFFPARHCRRRVIQPQALALVQVDKIIPTGTGKGASANFCLIIVAMETVFRITYNYDS